MCSVILSAALFVDLVLLPENERLAGKRNREKRKEKGKKNRSANEADQPNINTTGTTKTGPKTAGVFGSPVRECLEGTSH